MWKKTTGTVNRGEDIDYDYIGRYEQGYFENRRHRQRETKSSKAVSLAAEIQSAATTVHLLNFAFTIHNAFNNTQNIVFVRMSLDSIYAKIMQVTMCKYLFFCLNLGRG